MPPNKARFVTTCQQLLTLATVLAVLAPAANVVSLDVLVTRPGSSQTAVAKRPVLERDAQLPVEQATAPPRARVETEPVDAEVTEVPMQARRQTARELDRPEEGTRGEEELVSTPEPVTGLGAVGVTWSSEAPIEDDQIDVSVRTRTGDTWSGWQPIEYHDEHQPDPDTPEGRGSRPGTEPMLVGDVDEVQARAVTEGGVAAVDMKLAVIDPGKSGRTAVEPGNITLPEPAAEDAEGRAEESAAGEGAIELQAAAGEESVEDGALELAAATPPAIFSRKQWGADEGMRSGSPRYGTIRAGFVHHTVNANGYTRDQVPGIIRSIYAYHTRSRGWSDIGYNFLVDRFGRIWEGRYGGVTRPVIGAHTLGYNEYSFAMSAIGNFDIAQPTSAMLPSYGKLMGWKLSLHGVNAMSTSQRLGSKTFAAINGHRDAGSTACPGRYLYAKLPTIRRLARDHQLAGSSPASQPSPEPKPVDRSRSTDLLGSSHPDLVLRRRSDGAGFLIPTEGVFRFGGRVSSTGYAGYNLVLASPDLTGDGRADLLVRRRSDGRTAIRPGTGDGRFGTGTRGAYLLRGMNAVVAPGDLNGDGRNDLVTRETRTGRLWFYRGRGDGTFDRFPQGLGWRQYNLLTATGDVTGDGRADLLARDASGRLWVHPGRGNGSFGGRSLSGVGWARYDTIVGFGDWTGDGRPDLLGRDRASGAGFIHPGRGQGKFSHWIGPFAATRGLQYLSSGGSAVGGPDPEITGVRDGTLTVVRHSGTYHTGPTRYAGRIFAGTNLVLNAGDWNGDGKGDLLTRHAGHGNLRLHTGDGRGSFAAPTPVGVGWNNNDLVAAVGDLTGDGKPDVIGQPKDVDLRYYPGNGTGRIQSWGTTGVKIDGGAESLAVGMWDEDAIPDVMFRYPDRLRWFRGTASGPLEGGADLTQRFAHYSQVVAAGDVDGDKRPDLVARDYAGNLFLLAGRQDGFPRRIFLAGGLAAYDLVG